MGTAVIDGAAELTIELNKLAVSDDDVIVVRVEEYLEPGEMQLVMQQVKQALASAGLGGVVVLASPKEITVDTLRTVPDEWLERFKDEWERRWGKGA